MEQRIGPSIQPLQGAAADPAFVPGITGPRPEEPEETASAEAEETAVTEEAVEEEPEEAAPEPEESTEDGPVFEAADRRARIVADGRGVRLSLDEESCEFRWDEIGAVETATARFGKRFTVTVHTPDRRWYPIEIEAPARASFKEWESQLDAVLDAYFEEDEKAETGEKA
ncbi:MULTISPECIES: hypothetical protein [unclassified Streptomyces]|uniref:hypothetical protein n=1 Tax=unclassified Streptomyces TaxID=2593676 RepID=UPI00093EF85A|nr:hypothetical protein [Streptomyces sp. TSRI0107]OKJ87693.1 hypothetical protein AMK31_11065 [Streptomyces sp. TSRI0107]